MNIKSKNTDILHGPLVKSLILFTLPIALSSMVQQLFNSADTWVVGYFGDPDALAAVGINTETVALVVTLSAGLAVGANVAVAAAVGKNRTDQVRSIAASAVVIALTVGLAGLIVGQYAAAPLLRLIKTPENIFDMSELYLRIYFYGYPFLLLYDFGAAILRAEGDSRYPFLALIASGAVNIILNIIFVAALGAGVAGVAAATGISTAVSAVLVTFKLYKRGDLVLSAGELQGFFKDTAEILKTGIPAAVQGAVFCFANIFVQASVNLFGSEAIAGSAVAMNFEYFVYYVITAFGQTATTFTGQTYAAGNMRRCRGILRCCLLLSLAASLLMTVAAVVFRRDLAGLFTDDGVTAENACLRIMCILVFEPVCSLYEIPAGALRGAGHPLLPAVSTVVGTCVFRIVWIFTVFRRRRSLKLLYYAFPLSWVVTIALVALCFFVTKPFSERC